MAKNRHFWAGFQLVRKIGSTPETDLIYYAKKKIYNIIYSLARFPVWNWKPIPTRNHKFKWRGEKMSEVEFIDIFANNLCSLMQEVGINRIELANEAHLAKGSITRYLSGERMPSLRAIVNLSMALNCEIYDLIPNYDYID
jgi:hypothetical protein|nr:MAG TPA_asm: helix-turn-helix domain protein [Caudoviricetes sp.]